MSKMGSLADLEKLVRNKFMDIEKALNFKDDEHRQLVARVQKLEEHNKSLQLENNVLKFQINNVMVNTIKSNTAKIDDQEQYMRRDCVEIKGVPAREEESTNDIVVQIADLMGVELDESDISISHRLPANKQWTDSEGVTHPPSPPSIIAKFVRREIKDSFYDSRYKLKEFSSVDLEGLRSADKYNLYVSESLTQVRKKLYKSALKVKKELKFKYLTTSNGRIYLKEDKGKKAFLINNESDFAKVRKSRQGAGNASHLPPLIQPRQSLHAEADAATPR